MTADKKLLLCVGVFLVLYLGWMAVLIFAATKSEKPTKRAAQFDERQIAAQGTAFKWAFWSMLGYNILYMFICGIGGIVWCDDILSMWLGVIVGTTVFCVVCIFRDAYLGRIQSKAGAIILINLFGFGQGLLGLRYLTDGTIIENGVLTADSMYLFITLMALVIDAAFLIKRRMDKREAEA